MSKAGWTERLVEAIEASVAAVAAAHQGESISGYALLTDDELSTLSHLACTEEYLLRHSGPPETRWIAVNWPYSEGHERFRATGEELRQWHLQVEEASDDEFNDHVRGSFEGITRALEQARARGILPSGALVLACSTDPGPSLRRLAVGAARALNSSDNFENWKSGMGY